MTDDLMQRLRDRKGFFLNGAAWVMSCDPDPDCADAADEIERLRAEVAGWIEQHARDSAELRSLCAARDEARQQRSDMLDDLLAAQSELAALRKRVEDAPVALVDRWAGGVWVLHKADLGAVCEPLRGKRVRLVVEG